MPLLDQISHSYYLAWSDLFSDRINNDAKITYAAKSAWMKDHNVEDKDSWLEIINWIDMEYLSQRAKLASRKKSLLK